MRYRLDHLKGEMPPAPGAGLIGRASALRLWLRVALGLCGGFGLAAYSSGCHESKTTSITTHEQERADVPSENNRGNRRTASTPADDYVAEQATDMAREDQDRAAQALKRPRRSPYRDRPVRPQPPR